MSSVGAFWGTAASQDYLGGLGGVGWRRELMAWYASKSAVLWPWGPCRWDLWRQRGASVPFSFVVVLHQCSASVHRRSVMVHVKWKLELYVWMIYSRFCALVASLFLMFPFPIPVFSHSCSSGLLHFQGTAPEHGSSEVQGVVCKGAKELLDV